MEPAGSTVQDTAVAIQNVARAGRASHSDRTLRVPPTLCFLDITGEALAGLRRPGNAGANSEADHITVLDKALAQGRGPRSPR